MSRLTITLPDEVHRALKEAAASRRRTIGELVAESLESYGIKSAESAREIVSRARAHSRLDEAEALEVAVAETRASRST